MVSPAKIAYSDYNQALLGGAKLETFTRMRGLFRGIATCVRRAREPTTVYGYWPDLDSLGHRHGIDDTRVIAHLDLLEDHLERLSRQLAGTDTLLLVCADHGQLDARESDVIELSDLGDITECLRIPLCGEPRAAYCYVKPDKMRRFERLVSDLLSDRFDLHPSSDAISSGLFGNGLAHPQLQDRLGDYILIARNRAAVHQRLPHENPFAQIGIHGGCSPDELLVPLCRCDA